MREAKFYEKRQDGRTVCLLCPRECKIPEGKDGYCKVRVNRGGTLYALAYGKPSAIHVDPVEKKPLYHFLPGTDILSIGTIGCTLGCKFCQNYDLSRGDSFDIPKTYIPPERLVSLAKAYGCPSIAFTYNEPTVIAEYVMDVSEIARKEGIKSVMVTNTYITTSAVKEVYKYIDGANCDLKSFSDEFYRKMCYGKLTPVLDALVEIASMNVWIEVTNLLIPGLNDSEEEIKALSKWVKDNLGQHTPLHFSAFHPTYKLLDRQRTPPQTLHKARNIAMDVGLEFVYEGNIMSDGANTYCPNCKKLLIERSWHQVLSIRLDSEARCSCGRKIQGIGMTGRPFSS